MSTESRDIRVGDLRVTVVRKAIKNLHLGVYPPHGRVRVAAPLAVSDDAVRLAVISRLGWIRRQRARFAAQLRQAAREMVSGETHYFLGRRYRLRVVEHRASAAVVRRGSILELRVRPGAGVAQRERVLLHWYRGQLKQIVPPLVAKWEVALGVRVKEWGIKRMKTRWGACNAAARRIWLNLELAKKPAHCLEYVVLHEVAHLVERQHNARFLALMDRHMPQWQTRRRELNAGPLAHEQWYE